MRAGQYGFAFLAGLAFASLAPCVAAEPPPASDVATSMPCSSDTSDPRGLRTAFAYDLESPDILRLVRALAAVPEREQRRIFEMAIATAKSGPGQDVRLAVGSHCRNNDAVYGALRATYVIVNDWTLDELEDAPKFRAFDAVVATAISALSLGDELTPEQRLTATRPFVGFDLQAPPRPLPSASGACTSAARTLSIARPAYPAIAVSARTTGKVSIKVSLSDTGEVRSATVLHDTLGEATGAEELRRASIFAAATSTYAPEMSDCVPKRGSYIFQTDYTSR